MKIYIRLVGKVHFHKAEMNVKCTPVSFTVNDRMIKERDVAEMYKSTTYYVGNSGAVRKRECCDCCDDARCNQPLME